MADLAPNTDRKEPPLEEVKETPPEEGDGFLQFQESNFERLAIILLNRIATQLEKQNELLTEQNYYLSYLEKGKPKKKLFG